MTVRRSSRATRIRRLPALAVVAAVAVTGCGADLNPGTAATVNDTRFSQSRVDNLVRVFCDYVEIVREQGGGAQPPLPVADVRSNLTSALITFELTDLAAEQLGLSVNRSTVVNQAEQYPIPAVLDDADAQLLEDFFEDASRSTLQTGAVGAHLQDTSGMTADQYLKTFAAEQDVVVNPAYGVWNGTIIDRGSGSLSDPVSQAAQQMAGQPVAGLPPSQVCG